VTTAAPGQPTVLDYTTTPAPSRRGKGFLAVCATILLPGLGHFIAGFRRRGLLWLAAAVVLAGAGAVALAVPALVPALLVLLPLALIMEFVRWLDAYLCGRRSTAPMLRTPPRRYLVGVALLAVAVFAAPTSWLARPIKRVAEAFHMPANAMSPALVAGDRFLCHKRVPPERWDIVLYESPVTPPQKFVSRVVGLPGETIEIVEGRLRINGDEVRLPAGVAAYSDTAGPGIRRFTNPGTAGRPIRLASDEFYVVGDNSAVSYDSRAWNETYPGHQLGAVPRDRIVGRVTYIYWPVARWRKF
jgi:signal peptidase I